MKTLTNADYDGYAEQIIMSTALDFRELLKRIDDPKKPNDQKQAIIAHVVLHIHEQLKALHPNATTEDAAEVFGIAALMILELKPMETGGGKTSASSMPPVDPSLN